MNQLVLVRGLPHCPACGLPKDKGLLVCWPCHGRLKSRHNGDYGKRMETKLAKLNAAMEKEINEKQTSNRAQHAAR